MPMDELRELALEWANTGVRPESVAWFTVNALRWSLTASGEIDRLHG